MKVLDQGSQGLPRGMRLAVGELGLPVSGTHGLLIVFWKDR